MKVGILTYHHAYNYGAYLQACALCGRLNQTEQVEAEIIDYFMIKEVMKYDVNTYSLKRKIVQILKGKYFFNTAIGKSFELAQNDDIMHKSSDSLVSDSVDDFCRFIAGKYDAIVVGSDEIWKVNNFRGFPNPYWLVGVKNVRKLSYAASARVEFDKVMNKADYKLMVKSLREFDFIGVRDQFTFDEIKKAADKSQTVAMCADPSFLYDFKTPSESIIKRISSRKGFIKGKKTFMVMVDDENTAMQIREQLKGKCNLVSVFKPYKGYINVPDLKPLEWLKLIQESDFIIASFFHAICFSIINNKPFLALGTAGKKSKLTELLSTDELLRHYVETDGKTPDYVALIKKNMRKADYSEFVAEKRKSFDDFLKALLA